MYLCVVRIHDNFRNLARTIVRRPREYLHPDVCARAVDVALGELTAQCGAYARIDDTAPCWSGIIDSNVNTTLRCELTEQYIDGVRTYICMQVLVQSTDEGAREVLKKCHGDRWCQADLQLPLSGALHLNFPPFFKSHHPVDNVEGTCDL